MENTVSVNAVQLRQSLGELLNRVYYQGITVHIKRRGKVIAKIIPSDTTSTTANSQSVADTSKTVGNQSVTGVTNTQSFSSDDLRKIQEDLLNNRL